MLRDHLEDFLELRHACLPREQRQRRAGRNRKIGAYAVVAAVAIVAGIIAVATLRTEDTQDIGTNPRSIQRPGVYIVDLRTGDRRLVADIDPDVGELAVSPDGTMVAYVALSASGIRPVVHVADLDGSNVRLLERTEASPGGAIAPRWSPEGSTIVYQGKGSGEHIGNLFLVDVATGETTQLTDLEDVTSSPWFMGPTFTPDGDTILFTTLGAGSEEKQVWNLWAVPVTGGEPTLVRRNAGIAGVSPDGRQIAYVVIRSDATTGDVRFGCLFVAKVDGSDARRLAEGQFVWPRWSPDGSLIAYSDERLFTEAAGAAIYVIAVRTGETSTVFGEAAYPEWVDDDTLIFDLTD